MHIFTLQGPVHIIRENQILESGVSRRLSHPNSSSGVRGQSVFIKDSGAESRSKNFKYIM